MSNSLYVASDFHGNINALKKTMRKMQEGKKVAILGDALDRGKDGLNILEGIRNLNQIFPDLVEYLPGNHDQFLYDALYNGMRAYEQTNNIGDLQQYAIQMCDKYINDNVNGMAVTYQDLKNMVISNPKKVYELGKWIEEQPLLRIENVNGKNVALGHASFDMELYQRGYNLKNFKEDEVNNPILHEKARLCIWYRDEQKKGNQRDTQSAKNLLILPTYEQASDIVVGHTPRAGEINLVGKNGSRKAYCVDAGIFKEDSQNQMLKYEDGNVEYTQFLMDDSILLTKETKIEKKVQTKNEEQLNAEKMINEIMNLDISKDMSEFEVLRTSVLDTAVKYGPEQAKKAIDDYINTGSLNGFTKQNSARENMQNFSKILTPDTVKEFMNFMKEGMKTNEAIAQNNGNLKNSFSASEFSMVQPQNTILISRGMNWINNQMKSQQNRESQVNQQNKQPKIQSEEKGR